MFRFIFFIVMILACASANAQSHPYAYKPASNKTVYDKAAEENDEYFKAMELGKQGLGRRAFDYAMIGYKILKKKGRLRNPDILTIADMSLPSGKKRLFVIDLKNKKLLFVTYVAHGRNTGLDKALYFSNDPESFKSSVGFYVTLQTYTGKHGYSMQLDGQEIGFNDNAQSRAIVMHGAEYVSAAVVKGQGYIGRSLGCPAVSTDLFQPIIGVIKNGSCLFIYGNDNEYIKNSKFLLRPILQEKKQLNSNNEDND